jgi:hypothetical protein
MRLVITALLLLLPATIRTAAAQGTSNTHDAHLWAQVLATVSVSDNWRLHLEEQPRWNDNVSQSFQILTRTAVGRRINNRLTLWAGHAWIAKPPGEGVTHEQRAWQQASITLPAAKRWAPSIRLRQEQRWQSGWADNSHRLRMMGRVVRPMTASGQWSLAAWNESMVTLDDTSGGPAQGFDQNRAFGGLLRRFSPHASLEFGYMWVTNNVPVGPRTNFHVPFVWLNLTY